MAQGFPILSLVTWLPIAFGVAVLAVGNDRNPAPARWTALVGAILGFLACLPLWTGFSTATGGAMQFEELRPWIPLFNVNYHLGVDGISMPLIALNSFMTVLVVVAHWEVVTDKVAQYLAAFLVMSGLINGTFAALDAILFYVFFEAMLIPMFLIIGVWGGPNRVYAAVKFFLYTLLGSLLMLAAFVYLYHQTNGSFEILDYHKVPLGMTAQVLVFLAMFMSFAVKVPMWPVHTWLPDAHVEAPTAGSVILASILLKMGTYGFLRFSLPMLPDASERFAPAMILLSVIAIIYGAYMALAQADLKKLIAYSSVSHMGFVTLGIFTFTQQGIEGAVMQMVNHGITTGGLFLCVGAIYERTHSRMIVDNTGLAGPMPRYATFLVIFALSSLGLPGTNSFVGEFLVLAGTFLISKIITAIAALGVILAAAYLLWMVQRVVFGTPPGSGHLSDLGLREMATFVPLIVLVFWLGFFPNVLLSPMHSSVTHLLEFGGDTSGDSDAPPAHADRPGRAPERTPDSAERKKSAQLALPALEEPR